MREKIRSRADRLRTKFQVQRPILRLSSQFNHIFRIVGSQNLTRAQFLTKFSVIEGKPSNPRGELMNQLNGLMDYYDADDYNYEQGLGDF